MDFQWNVYGNVVFMAVLEWLVRLLNTSFDMGVVPMELRGSCLVPL